MPRIVQYGKPILGESDLFTKHLQNLHFYRAKTLFTIMISETQ